MSAHHRKNEDWIERELRELARETPEARPGAAAAIMAAIEAEAAPSRGRMRTRRIAWAGAALLALGMFAVLVRPPQPDPGPQPVVPSIGLGAVVELARGGTPEGEVDRPLFRETRSQWEHSIRGLWSPVASAGRLLDQAAAVPPTSPTPTPVT